LLQLKGDIAEYLSTQVIKSTVFGLLAIVSFNDANAHLESPPSLPDQYGQTTIIGAWAMPDHDTSANDWFAQNDLPVRSLPPASSFTVSFLVFSFSFLQHRYIQQIEPAFGQCNIDLLVAPGDTDKNRLGTMGQLPAGIVLNSERKSPLRTAVHWHRRSLVRRRVLGQ
jgi:hypothetical protein